MEKITVTALDNFMGSSEELTQYAKGGPKAGTIAVIKRGTKMEVTEARAQELKKAGLVQIDSEAEKVGADNIRPKAATKGAGAGPSETPESKQAVKEAPNAATKAAAKAAPKKAAAKGSK